MLQVRALQVESQPVPHEPRQSRIAGSQDCSGHQDRCQIARDVMDEEIGQEDCQEHRRAEFRPVGQQ